VITAFNLYYAQPGQTDAVLRQRHYACDVRQSIGIPRGTVMSRVSGAADLPDVMWEQDFDDVAAHERDMAARAASAEFERVRAGMRQLIRRFERPLFEVCDNAAAPASAAPVVALQWVFCRPEAVGAALDAVDEVATHCARRGLERGRRLRLVTSGLDLPAVIWARRYVDDGSLDRASSAIAAAAGTQALVRIADRVEHSVWSLR